MPAANPPATPGLSPGKKLFLLLLLIFIGWVIWHIHQPDGGVDIPPYSGGPGQPWPPPPEIPVNR
jgi:hypothetical protein